MKPFLNAKTCLHLPIAGARFMASCIAAFALVLSAATSSAQALHRGKLATTASKSAVGGREWWNNAVIYEVYPRSFQDTNGDGIGDLNGIIERLDYLQSLGIDAIWLAPVYPSPNYDFGYDVSDYFNINPEYGTLSNFDRLVSEAKKRNIRIIMDMVMNHTSYEHPWFLASRSSDDNPYRDWYVWRNGKAETATDKGQPPNNWGAFGRSPWEWDDKTRQYYYHHFSVQQPDLNWYNPNVKRMFKNITAFWLKRGIAGYRFDAIGGLFEDPNFEDEAVAKDQNGKSMVDARGNPQLERTKEFNLPAVHIVMNEMHGLIHSFDTTSFPGSRVLIGETNTRNLDELIRWYGTSDKPEFDIPMDVQVGFINKLDVATFRSRLIDAETGLGNHVPLLVFDNHDRPRLDARYGDGVHDSAIQRVLATILFASGGATLVYYGDEIGMRTTPPARIEDVKDRMEGYPNWPRNRGRDGERTPMQWDSGVSAGFTTGNPWLPVPHSAKEINVKAEERDPDSLLAWYRALIKLKKTNAALAHGSNVMLEQPSSELEARGAGHRNGRCELEFHCRAAGNKSAGRTGPIADEDAAEVAWSIVFIVPRAHRTRTLRSVHRSIPLTIANNADAVCRIERYSEADSARRHLSSLWSAHEELQNGHCPYRNFVVQRVFRLRTDRCCGPAAGWRDEGRP